MLGCLAGFAWLLGTANLQATVTVTTLGGGNPKVSPKYLGYKDGTTLSTALFHTPQGIAVDPGANNLYVADRDNNAIRRLDLAAGWTYTFKTAGISQPVGVAVNNSGEVFVLNRGTGNNGTVLQFASSDVGGDLVATNATGLTNAAGIALDLLGNIYVTVRNNTLMRIAPNGSKTNIAVIPNAGTSLQGLVVKNNGLIAVCDSGRNGIYLIDPATGLVSTNAGFHGVGDFPTNGNNVASAASAKFNQPYGVAEAGDGTLIVTDYGNHRVKIVTTTGVVTNLCGVASNYWGGTYKGWYDGGVFVPDSIAPNAQSRLPVGVAFGSDGAVYLTEDYYHLIRKVSGSGLPLPPLPPPQVPTPKIGWVNFPPQDFTSVLHLGSTNFSSFVFNNDVLIVIQGVGGSQTYYNFGATPLVANPTVASASAPVGYEDGQSFGQASSYAVAGILPDLTIKAIGEKNDGSPNSAIAQARFQFIVGNAVISGNNAAQFSVTNITEGSVMYYTVDGTDPTNAAPSLGPIIPGTILHLGTSNFMFKIRGFRPNYQPSGIVSNVFSSTSFIPNRITFGLTNGEPSSSFIARPGQFFYAPVSLQLQPGGDTLYSLQFNIAVTNGPTTPNKIVNGAGIDFHTMLMSKVPPAEGNHYPPSDGQWYLEILPFISGAGGSNSITSSIFVNTNQNLLGVGWLYRKGFKYTLTDTNGQIITDFDPATQDLITYSIAHDTLFNKSGGVVVVGTYSFQVPASANTGDQYFMQIGSPSGTRDGVGAPGADVYIRPPASGQAVTVGSPAYIVGDVAPFRWLNAGDFGEGTLNNADVMQVFQSAILGVDLPPANSDLYLAMDSCGGVGVYDSAAGYYTNAFAYTNVYGITNVFDGNDTTINTNAFGDGILDACDVYVTYRRSLDPSLTWFKRFWTNNQFVAVTTPNLAYNSNTPALLMKLAPKALSKTVTSAYQPPSVQFAAGDAVAAAGQTIQIPITANIFGSYPLRVLALNLTVVPLDGSPAITQPVQFTPAAGLGQPTIAAPKYAANYSAVWLNSQISGLTGNATIGTLTITLPAGAPSSAAYAIHFDHASASPNGIVPFPEQKLTGLVTLSSRTNSSYNDGVPDSWRLRWFGTANNLLSVSNACPSGDGVNNYMKYVAGVDPSVAGNFPKVNSKTPLPAGYAAAIHWPTVSGKQYVIERSASLFPGAWTTISTNTGTGTDMEFDDDATGQSQFYRVRILP